MRRTLKVTAAVIAAALLSPGVTAEAAALPTSRTYVDEKGDARGYRGTEPTYPEIDIRNVTYYTKRSNLRIDVRVRNVTDRVAQMERDRFEVSTRAANGTLHQILVAPYDFAGVRVGRTRGTTSQRPSRCVGAWLRMDPATDTIRWKIPLTCLANPRRLEVKVYLVLFDDSKAAASDDTADPDYMYQGDAGLYMPPIRTR